jgi:ERCC4-related helicase
MSEHTKGTVTVPYQAAFVEQFVRPGSPFHHLLVAPPGTGKAHTACTIVERLATMGQARHVLVLAPAPLRAQWAAALASTDIAGPVVALDRQVFRELQAAVPIGRLPWEQAPVVVMSLELARHADVFEAVVAQAWDLIIVDECHRIKVIADQRQGIKVDDTALLRQLIEQKRVRRLLLMTATLGKETSYVPNLAVTQWHVAHAAYQLTELVYFPDADEMRFVTVLNQFLDSELVGDSADVVRGIVRCRAESSVFSVEPALLRWLEELRGGPAEAMTLNAADEVGDGEPESTEPLLVWRDTIAAVERIQQLLSMLDAVQSDAKLRALLQLIEERRRSSPVQEVVCVVTLYARTALYLHSALVDAGIVAGRATGDMTGEERVRAIHDFRARGGVLVATYSFLEGIEMPEARTVIAYDILAPAAMEQVIGRFNRYGRREPLTVIAMRRSTASAEPSAAPNGGPTLRPGNSGAAEGPPSVS